MEAQNPMIGVAVAAMRWHHARLRRLEAERQHKASDAHPLHIGWNHTRQELEDSRRLESRYKRRLMQSCEKASDRKQQHEVIDI